MQRWPKFWKACPVSTSRIDRNYHGIGVHGFGRPTDFNNRILLLLNGQPLNGNVYGQARFGTSFPIDMDAIERIEVVRGPASSLYGANAMFAVLNLVTKTDPGSPPLRLAGRIGSAGTYEGRGSIAGRSVDGGFSVAARWADIAGRDVLPGNADATAEAAEEMDWDRHGGLLATGDIGGLHVQGWFSTRRKGIPTAPYGSTFGDDRASTLDEQLVLSTAYAADPHRSLHVEWRAHLNRYYYKGQFPGAVQRMAIDTAEGEQLGTEVRARWDPRVDNRLTGGVEYRTDLQARYAAGLAPELLVFDGEFPTDLVSGYVEDTHQVLDNLAITLGIRHDSYSVEASSTTTPRGAVVYHPSQSSTVKVVYGEAFRVPTLIERHVEFPGALRSNAALRPEKIRALDAIAEHRLSRSVLGSVGYFRYDLFDFIDIIRDPTTGVAHFDNVLEMEVQGIQAELTARMQGGLHGRLSYAYQRAVDEAAGDERLPNSPMHQAKVGLNARLHDRVTAAADVLYETGRRTIQGRDTEPYLLTHFTLTARPGAVRARLRIRNLLNEQYAHPGGLPHTAPIDQDGRRVDVEVGYEF
ncbi:TonB-dependent receptor [Candidatus Poribacteria bacterium]|nr:TonB-dependent receptor [Candidatus Poribacteria bacterium]